MYSFDSIVRYSETDEFENLSLTGLVNYFQDCSSFQSEMLQVGMDELVKVHRGWVLSAWQIVIHQMPKIYDKITINTWPYDFDKFFGSRNFTITNDEGIVLASANSFWVHINTDSGRPTLPEGKFKDNYILEDRYEGMSYEERKIVMPENMTCEECFKVRRCHLDSFHHVNNAQYIQMAEDYLPDGFQVRQIRTEYKVSAVYGNMICPFVQMKEDGRFVVDLRSEQGRTYAVVEFAR